MTLPARALLLLCALAASGARAAPFLAAPERAFGVLLLGQGGDHNWKEAQDKLGAALGPKFPLAFALGEADPKALQAGIDALAARRVKKIVVIPLFVSSLSEALEQTRYLLGIRKEPSKAFLSAPHSHPGAPSGRVQSKVPLILTRALDDHDILVDILASRAKSLSRRPAKESLLLVGQGPSAKEASREWLSSEAALAEKVRRKGGFKSAQAAVLRLGLAQDEREKSEAELRALVKALRRAGEVIVVPLELTPGAVRSRVPKALDGLLYRWDGKTLLPDVRLARWVEASAQSGAKLPDMRTFKNEKRPVPGSFPSMPPLGKHSGNPGGAQ